MMDQLNFVNTFLPALPSSSGISGGRVALHSPHPVRRLSNKRPTHVHFPISLASHTPHIASSPLQDAAKCLVDDFVKSGMNVVIGGDDEQLANAVCSTLATQLALGSLMDISVRGTTGTCAKAVRVHELPQDVAINLKGEAVDIFVTGARQIDADLNVSFLSECIPTERYVAKVADACLVVADEQTREEWLSKVAVQCDRFMPGEVVRYIERDPTLKGIVKSARLRKDGSGIADILLRSGHRGSMLDQDLQMVPGVFGVGILPEMNNTTAIIFNEHIEPYDMTGSLSNIRRLAQSGSLKKLIGDSRKQHVATLGDEWKDGVGGRDMLQREFRFRTHDQAKAFVREVHRLAEAAQNFPEIFHVYNRVTVTLHTIECGGVSELDIAIARELSATCHELHGCGV